MISIFQPRFVGDKVLQPIDDTRGIRALTFLLSATAGSVDAIGFLGLDGLFIAHITGNLVILAARIGAGGQAPIAHLLSVPVFIAVLAATRLLAAAFDRSGIATLRPLLFLQLLLLSPCLGICIAMGSVADPDRPVMVLAAMLGVSAMAVQNALVQISLKDVPSTAVMTTNWTRFVLDLGEAWLGNDPAGRSTAIARARRTGTAIAGFVTGAGLGALCQAHVGLLSLVLPTALALAAFAVACYRRWPHQMSIGDESSRCSARASTSSAI
jgi:uncharacterized membrane protein YoaK (UPF0700 family)